MSGLGLPEGFRIGVRIEGPLALPPPGIEWLLQTASRTQVRLTLGWRDLQPAGRGRLRGDLLDTFRRAWEPAAAAGLPLCATLHAGALPDVLCDRGGWSDRDIVGRFADYAAQVGRALGEFVDSFVLIDDPWGAIQLDLESANPLAPRGPDAFLRATHLANLAMAEATRALRSERADAAIGRAVRAGFCEPYGDGDSDADAALRFHRFTHLWFVEPGRSGRYPDAFPAERTDERMDLRDSDRAALPCDLDFVRLLAGPTLRVRAIHDEFGLEAVPAPVAEAERLDIDRRADAVESLAVRLSEDLPDLPLELTAASPERLPPSRWRAYHEAALEAVSRATERQVLLRAYDVREPPKPDATGEGLRVEEALRFVVETAEAAIGSD